MVAYVRADRKNGRQKTPKARTKSFHRSIGLSVTLVLLTGLAVAGFLARDTSKPPASIQKISPAKSPRTLAELLELKPAELEGTDIALMNLLCAEGLPGAEILKVEDCLATLDQWAQHAKREIDRNYHHFREDPAYYYHSEAFYKMLMLSVVVYEDFGVRYNPKLIAPPSEARGDDHFFADSRDILIHGMVGPQRMGTCSSMPILYIALGQRLGYPLKLVKARGHLFMRWDSPTEKFNMDATGKGLDKYDDEHYKQWPFPLTEAGIKEDDYLKSLSAAEELSAFLSIRGACQTDNGQLGDALASFNSAHRLVPTWKGNQVLLAEARQRLARPIAAAQQQQANPGIASVPPDPNPLRRIQPQGP